MTTAYLTIDDGPSPITKDIMDYLLEKHIVPIMFFRGDSIRSNWENGIYAIKNGAIIGNHGYNHLHFSKLSLDDCKKEIEHTEEEINALYQAAGVTRPVKLFRFPYGNKGNDYRNDFQMDHKRDLQQYLKDQGFSQLDSRRVNYDWYYKQELDKDIDSYWTFDFEEYRLHTDKTFSFEKIIEHILNPTPPQGGNFFGEGNHNILLIHDHPETELVKKSYLARIINECLKVGVHFIEPTFRTI